MRHRPLAATLGGLLLVVILPCCSPKGGGTPQEPAVDFNEELQRAWGQFRARDFPAATTSFRLLSHRFPEAVEGRIGLGWCQVVADSLEDAYASFGQAGGMQGEPDAIAGIAVVASAMGWDSTAVEAASRANDPTWIFVGDPDFGYRDLVFIRALGQFHLRRYEDCYASLLILIPDLRIDMEAFDFREDLFAALESSRGHV